MPYGDVDVIACSGVVGAVWPPVIAYVRLFTQITFRSMLRRADSDKRYYLRETATIPLPRILVTGAHGALGSALVRRLAACIFTSRA